MIFLVNFLTNLVPHRSLLGNQLIGDAANAMLSPMASIARGGGAGGGGASTALQAADAALHSMDSAATAADAPGGGGSTGVSPRITPRTPPGITAASAQQLAAGPSRLSPATSKPSTPNSALTTPRGGPRGGGGAGSRGTLRRGVSMLNRADTLALARQVGGVSGLGGHSHPPPYYCSTTGYIFLGPLAPHSSALS